MLKKQIVIGKSYLAKISGNLTFVRIDSESSYGGWNATNLKTGRSVRIKSAQKLRREATATEIQQVGGDGPQALKNLLRF